MDTGTRRGTPLWLVLLLGLAVSGMGVARLLTAGPAPDAGVVPPANAASSASRARVEPGASEIEPSRLSLPTLGVDASVQPVDVRSDGQLAVPDDARVVGWWAEGARPGSPRGSVVIDGHVDTSRDGPGALFHLARLEPGAMIMITGSGGSLMYRVEAVRRYPKTALPAELFDRTGSPRLVLISCGGEFDRRTRHYADNIVAYAVPHSP
jgi:hypothetical protein